ncbi:hypothetical protein Lsan_0765 [Legionella santicrucis]|uniref:Uncharacterized protein n=1 Tax=Legionella santicrucis TaxID=45074 RepID=A0A0W0Z923_9GAMM|nr:hypothetical protein [Legionella santicrucis]KTD65611.1 hypothetical protein Lsan_0765 [Legionella santicrucis]
MYDKSLGISPKKHIGSLNTLNSETHKKDGFRLYICSPIQHHKDGRVAQILEPEIRFKANKKINGKSIGLAIKQKNSFICFQVMMNIISKVILNDIQLAQHKHKVFMNTLWSGLNELHKKEIIRTIYEKKPFLLSSKESVRNAIISGNNATEFFNIVCQNHPISTASTVAPEKASRILFIDPNVYAQRHGKESIALYTQKHPHECCIIHNRSALEKVLKLHSNKDQTITLTIFADNNIDTGKKCLDWTLETVGKKLGEIVKAHPCIGHLNLITCYSGSLDITKIHDAACYEKVKENKIYHDLYRFILKTFFPKITHLKTVPSLIKFAK